MTGLRVNLSNDAFLRSYDESELRTAAEFLSNWLPFLTRDLCQFCTQKLSVAVESLDAVSTEGRSDYGNGGDVCESETTKEEVETFYSCTPSASPSTKVSWADMAVEDEDDGVIQEDKGDSTIKDDGSSVDEISDTEVKPKMALSRDQREVFRFSSVYRKDFVCMQRVNGVLVNILDGLELHKGIFSAKEQLRIVNYVEELCEMGQNREMKGRTYSAPRKWMKGKGRITLQFGCCYNYAVDKKGNPPGILKDEMVDPLPHLFKVMIRRLVRWHVLPPTCVPDSCIVNIYEEGDCIPPHIDNHDFVRPFCTVSFLSECEILFGINLKIIGPGEFSGSYSIPLPVGSVLVLKGNGADVAKHCVPAVPSKRISITFRRMDESKRPYGYIPDPDLQGIKPLSQETCESISNGVSRQDHSSQARNGRRSRK